MKKLLLEIFTWWNGQTLGTRMHTLINGRLVGLDLDGNKYFINKKNTESRWVIYNGKMDASKINANWHDWIHYRTDEIPVMDKKEKSWYKKHTMNYTGTEKFYSPRNASKKTKRSTHKSYESWSPEERK